MKCNEFNKVPPWCPYTYKEISSYFKFNIWSDKGIVEYKCVHCKKVKYANINAIRMYVRRGIFTSLCRKCAGEIDRKKKEIFSIKSIPSWMQKWITSKNLSILEMENTLNNGKIIDVYQGKIRNRGIKFQCIKCHEYILASVSRIKTNIKLKKHTGLCNKCLSGVRHNVSIDTPRICNNGYVLIQKSLIPKEKHWLCDWSKPVMEHRFKMALKLNRPLTYDEVVHHIDGNKQNNSIENLELWNTSHPSGQRVIDKVNWAIDFLKKYNKEIK